MTDSQTPKVADDALENRLPDARLEASPRRFPVPPVWLLIGVAVLMAVGGVYLQFWLPWQNRLALLDEIESSNGRYSFEERGPAWIRRLAGRHKYGFASNRKIGPLDRVTHVSFRGRATHVIVSRLVLFSELKSLDISYSRATDDWMPAISRLEQLEELKLRHCRISGRGFHRLQRLRHLEKLTLTYCPIRDEHLEKLVKIRSLSNLECALCSHLTAEGVEQFLLAKPDCAVWLYGLSSLKNDLADRGFKVVRGSMIEPR